VRHKILQKIKRASGFFRTQDARAALPQNCSMGNVSLSGESENGTRVLICPPKVPAGKSHITKGVSKLEPSAFILKAPSSRAQLWWKKASP
jgi:hypothetical protein